MASQRKNETPLYDEVKAKAIVSTTADGSWGILG
jgi:hypothetical protein